MPGARGAFLHAWNQFYAQLWAAKVHTNATLRWPPELEALSAPEAEELAEEKKDERSRLVGLVMEIERFLSDGLVKV